MTTEKLSEIETRFLREARQKRRRIAIGIWRPEPVVVDNLWAAQGYADLVVVGSQVDGLNCLPTKDDDEASRVIVDLLKRGEVEGIVRAQLKDSFTHKVFLEAFPQADAKKANPVFVAHGDRWFVATAVSNYNALTLEQKRFEIFQVLEWLQDNLGIRPTIAITSTRRLTGRVGEFGLLEEIAQRCAQVAEELRQQGYDVKEYSIEYERAIGEGRTMICPSIGMIGNTWVKALVYLGGWKFVGVPYLHQGAYYDNCPRNYTQWFWPIISTAAWLNRGKL